MKSKLNQIILSGILLVGLPFVAGCNGGGGGSGVSSSAGISQAPLAADDLMFSMASMETATFAEEWKGLLADIPKESAGGIPISHNPEPATFLLFGIGAVAALKASKRKNRRDYVQDIK